MADGGGRLCKFIHGKLVSTEADLNPKPAFAEPPSELINAAMRDLTLIMADVSGSEYYHIGLDYWDLLNLLRDKGHVLGAAQWAHYYAVRNGRLCVELIRTYDPDHPEQDLNKRGPTAIIVRPTDRLWEGYDEQAAEPAKTTPEAEPAPAPAVRHKRSTVQGEAQAKIIAALTKHHMYADGGCLNLEPIGNNELARLASVSESTASAFFNKQFGGHTKYRVICADATRLVAALKLLNQEFAPHHLFGAKPPGEDEREDDE